MGRNATKAVLKSPFSSHWPSVDEACHSVVSTLLVSHFSNFLKTPRQSRNQDSFLIVGLNAVSRAMENKQLHCCIVAKDVKPITLISHIPSLAFHSNTFLIALSSFSLQLGSILGSKTVIAIGLNTVIHITILLLYVIV
ncbi:hypothetical protein GEMRC1_004569 [Eukaryota sp. GEM-RC1]